MSECSAQHLGLRGANPQFAQINYIIMTQTDKRIAELKNAMEIEQANGFPNGDLWNKMSDELDKLEMKPSIFELLADILHSPIDEE
jgi:hypothetical protein